LGEVLINTIGITANQGDTPNVGAGNLITLTDGIYTPKGNVRLSFVDHGADLSKEGAQSLADKVCHFER
jgi:hypothetical protein